MIKLNKVNDDFAATRKTIEKMKKNNLDSGQVFYIRYTLPNTPSLFERWAYEQRADLGIESVGKDRTGTNKWRKI